jgi:hypothetical protein
VAVADRRGGRTDQFDAAEPSSAMDLANMTEINAVNTSPTSHGASTKGCGAESMLLQKHVWILIGSGG